MGAKGRRIPITPKFMAAMPHFLKFKSLKNVTHEWSLQGGEPTPLTLRRICDWAICGAFPDGTFVFPNGEKVDLLDLHRSMRVATGLGAPINGERAIDLLQEAIVSIAGVEVYCGSVGVQPPRSIKTLTSRLRSLFDKPKYLSPPDCPESAEVIAQLEAKSSADALINTLNSILKQDQDQDRQGFDISAEANERWLRYVNLAESYSEPSKDPDIQRQLDALKHEWDSLKFAKGSVANLETPQVAEGGGAESTERKKRAIGRPTGSGSLERGDLKLVEEMRIGLARGEYLSIAAAAKAVVSKAGGAGTYSSREKRLTKRYSERHPR